MKYLLAFFTLLILFVVAIYPSLGIGINKEVGKLKPQSVDREQYYCHETGFLMHHWQMQKDGPYIESLITNRWDEPTKCEVIR